VDQRGSWLHRHRSSLVAIGGSVVLLALVVFAVWSTNAPDRGAVVISVLAVGIPALLWWLEHRSKKAGTAPAVVDGASPDQSESAPAPGPDHPRLALDPAGRIGGGDRTAAMAYVTRLKALPARERLVRTDVAGQPTRSAKDQARVAGDPDLKRARGEFERAATEFARGGAVYPWGPPSAEDWAIALETLWSIARKNSHGAGKHWYAWPPGGAAQPVVVDVPTDDELVKRASTRFTDRPVHIQNLDSRIVWRWVAPAAVTSACQDADGGLPVVLDEWRVSARDPRQLASVEPELGAKVASSAMRAWCW
jgi:hypothetical protein